MESAGGPVAAGPDPGVGPGPPPAVAVALFADRLPEAVAYAALLAGPGVVRGLIGPREVPRLWDRHLVNCGVVAAGLSRGARVADLGSGAGLPGVVVAILRPDLQVTLIEPLLRRATFLGEVVAELGLANAVVLRTRAEEHPRGGGVAPAERGYDAVLARAVAPLERLAGWALPLLRPGGRLLAVKGSAAAREMAEAEAALRALGAVGAEVREYGVTGFEAVTTVIEVVAGQVAAAPGPGRPARAAHGRRERPPRVSRETAGRRTGRSGRG